MKTQQAENPGPELKTERLPEYLPRAVDSWSGLRSDLDKVQIPLRVQAKREDWKPREMHLQMREKAPRNLKMAYARRLAKLVEKVWKAGKKIPEKMR